MTTVYVYTVSCVDDITAGLLKCSLIKCFECSASGFYVTCVEATTNCLRVIPDSCWLVNR